MFLAEIVMLVLANSYKLNDQFFIVIASLYQEQWVWKEVIFFKYTKHIRLSMHKRKIIVKVSVIR